MAGQTVKDHIKVRGVAVKQRRVAEGALRGAGYGGKNVLRRFVAVAERGDNGIYRIAFFFTGHAAYKLADFFSAASEENEEYKNKDEKTSDKQIHNNLHKVFLYFMRDEKDGNRIRRIQNVQHDKKGTGGLTDRKSVV